MSEYERIQRKVWAKNFKNASFRDTKMGRYDPETGKYEPLKYQQRAKELSEQARHRKQLRRKLPERRSELVNGHLPLDAGAYIPTPEEIQAQCEAIRKTWSPYEEQQRLCHPELEVKLPTLNRSNRVDYKSHDNF